MTATQDDYDSPWKGALEQAFPEFMAFYFADAHGQIDWSRGHVFLDKELRQIARSAAHGARNVDKLVQVHRRDGREDWIYVHVEIQSQHDGGFEKRMFVYNYRIFDRYDRPVASLAVLADDRPTWRPAGFGYSLFGCTHRLDFPLVKLTDYAAHGEALAADQNPFALVTLAHLHTLNTRTAPLERFAAKRRLVRLLYTRNWNKTRVIEFFTVLDWMMRLPEELEAKLWHDIEEIEGEHKVKYVTSIERLAIERGRQLGMEQGLEQGLEQGIEQGIEQGRVEGSVGVLRRLLMLRFGALSEASIERLGRATAEQVDQWTERVISAETLEDVFRKN